MKKIITLLVSSYLNLLNLFSSRLGGKHAFYIFCYPFKAKITKKQQRFLDTAEQFQLPVDDFKIQCYRWGTGPRKILLVHGWQSNSYRWKTYIASFAPQEFSVYSFDAPGHGNSESKIGNVPLYNKALKVLIEKTGKVETIIAHSIGSFSTLYHLHLYPAHQPQKMISLAAPFSAQEFIEHFLERLNLSTKTVANFKAYFLQYANQEISYFNLNNLFSNIPIKGLIVHDHKDQMVPVKFAKKLHQLWKESTLLVTDGYGHKLKSPHIAKEVKAFAIH